MNENWTLKDHRNYAWEYFKVHAQQRMSLFNFFVIFSSLIIAGVASTFQDKLQVHLVGAGLGGLLILISFVFWKLDQRVRFLLKHSEIALKQIEDTYFSKNQMNKMENLQLFILEEAKTEKKYVPWYYFWKRHLTYYTCFCITYLVVGIIGTVSMILSIVCEINK